MRDRIFFTIMLIALTTILCILLYESTTLEYRVGNIEYVLECLEKDME